MSDLATKLLNRSSSLLRRALFRGAKAAESLERRTGRQLSEGVRPTVPFAGAFYGSLLPSHNIAPLTTTAPLLGRSGKVTLFLPSLGTASFFGGAATALIVAGKLAVRRGKGLRIVESVIGTGDASGLGRFFAEVGIVLEGEIEVVDISARRHDRPGSLDVHPDDDFVASAWWDAHVLGAMSLPRPFVYLIQDYEPIFYANGDRHVLAENTYRQEGFVPLCNTKLMRDFLAERYPRLAREARWFEPAVSHRRYGTCRRPEGKRTIFLYGRPAVERNLFYLALGALEAVFASGRLDREGWRVVMAGQDDLPDVVLSSGVTVENLGKLSLEAYRNLTLEVDLAVSLMMAPHPNYPTLELASVGASVVTTRYANKVDLSVYSANIVLADLTLESVADAIVKAATTDYETRLAQAASSSIGDDWEAALAAPIDEIATALKAV